MASFNLNFSLFVVLTILTATVSIYGGALHERSESKSSNCSEDEAYHVKTARCYQTGEQGPCGTDAVFMLDDDDVSITGSCSCNDFPSGNKCGGQPGVLWPQDLACYKLFSQGPCASEEWLVKTSEGPKCKQNPCLNFKTSLNETFVFYLREQCLETETQGFCNDSEIMIFESYGDDDEPKCFDNTNGACQVGIASASIVGPADCKQGQVVSSDGTCEDAVSFA